MARMPVSVQEAMKIPEAKAAVDTGQIQEHFIVGCEESEIKARSHPSGEKEGATVHIANLMDLCHLKNAELAKHLHK